jgi:hypothetical protein
MLVKNMYVLINTDMQRFSAVGAWGASKKGLHRGQ